MYIYHCTLIIIHVHVHRDKQVTKLKEKIESLKDQLYNCEADLEKASSALEASKYVMYYNVFS